MKLKSSIVRKIGKNLIFFNILIALNLTFIHINKILTFIIV